MRHDQVTTRAEAFERENDRLYDEIGDLTKRNNELAGAIRENSIVLLHLIAIERDETKRDLLQSIHDSLVEGVTF